MFLPRTELILADTEAQLYMRSSANRRERALTSANPALSDCDEAGSRGLPTTDNGKRDRGEKMGVWGEVGSGGLQVVNP
jgi:hypothetical protein